MINARLDPFFQERRLRLCDVEPHHIRELHESIFKDGCNANTVIHYHAVVRKALQYAVKNELISENAADKVDRPKKGKCLAAFYSKEELTAFPRCEEAAFSAERKQEGYRALFKKSYCSDHQTGVGRGYFRGVRAGRGS